MAPIRRSTRLLLLFAVVSLLVGVALAGTLRPARASGGTPLLPNLVADPPTGQRFERSNGHLLLRFNGYIHNKGPGALDIRGEREVPHMSQHTREVLEFDEAHEQENLKQPELEELANPKMQVIQRLFTTNVGEQEENIERSHVNEPSPGELVYSASDGHDHWHLQHAAKYSLWNAGRTAEVAPSQKVGFCLDDSEHVEKGIGPSTAAYSEATGRRFCQRYKAGATSLFEGVSSGWRDLYDSGLAFQWVDATEVLPGKYWLREDVNPDGIVKETGGTNVPEYATSAVIIPGYDAAPQTLETEFEEAAAVSLTSTKWVSETSGAPAPGSPVYALVSGPSHGKLGALSANHVTYTPDPGFSGTDSFTFSTGDSSNPKKAAAVATVTIGVGAAPETAPSLAIKQAPSSLVAGASGELEAEARNDPGAIEWSASAGNVTPQGARGETASFVAPAAAGAVTVTARLADDHSISVSREITVTSPPADEPAPSIPGIESGRSLIGSTPGTGVAGIKSAGSAVLSRPRAMLFGHTLVMSTTPSQAGRLKLTAWRGKYALGYCEGETPANLTFTCRVKLGTKAGPRSRISVVASLRRGKAFFVARLAPERVPVMKMVSAHHSLAAAASAGVYWCSPTTLVATLADHE
jgi:hypothetical protein